jgi:hypothetical protein
MTMPVSLEALGAGAQITEQNEDLVEMGSGPCRGAAPELVEALQLGAEHVVEHEQMMVAGTLGSLGIVADHRRV